MPKNVAFRKNVGRNYYGRITLVSSREVLTHGAEFSQRSLTGIARMHAVKWHVYRAIHAIDVAIHPRIF